jgi:uncharacterized Fe-S cluster protein YjdI/CDGSH-type Zn-finger protein
MTRRTYLGRDIEVSFDRELCIHIGACLTGLPDVFELARKPWILPDAADAETVSEQVRRCPSGALRYRRLDGAREEEPPTATTVTPLRNGPLLLTGALQITRPDGTVDSAPRATLCRCGLSSNKPFCDNSHLRSDFTAPGDRLRIPASPVRRTPDLPIARSDDPRT